MPPLAFIGSLGTVEIAVIGIVMLLMFGNRLPSVMRSLGKSVTEFKKGVSGIEDDLDPAVTSETKKPNPPNPEV
jgi:sec-independent protein translocase protein TatA